MSCHYILYVSLHWLDCYYAFVKDLKIGLWLLTLGGISEDWSQEAENINNKKVETGSKGTNRCEQEAKVEEYNNVPNLVILLKIKYQSIKFCHKERISALKSSG